MAVNYFSGHFATSSPSLTAFAPHINPYGGNNNQPQIDIFKTENMTRIFGTLLLLAALITCAHGADRKLSIERQVLVEQLMAGNRIGHWSNGLAIVTNNTTALPRIVIVSRDGRISATNDVQVPKAISVLVHGYDYSPNFGFAVTGTAVTAEKAATTFLYLSNASAGPTVITLFPFSADEVAIDSQGYIWMAGSQKTSDVDLTEQSASYRVIRRFDRRGNLLGSWVDRTSLLRLRPGLPSMSSFLRTNASRTAWYSNISAEYIEIGMNGKELLRMPGIPVQRNRKVTGFALCESNRVFVSFGSASEPAQVYELDRAAKSFSLVADGADAKVYWLYGCDGEKLITSGPQNSYREASIQ